MSKTGIQLKLDGMKRAKRKRSLVLQQAKLIAGRIAARRQSRECSIDDVYEYMENVYEGLHFHPRALGNAAGSVFKGSEWEFVRFEPSTRPSNHGRIIRVWRLRS